MQNDIHDAREQHEERIPGRLRLMDPRIELLERKRQVDVIDRQVTRHCRNPRQQQQREKDGPQQKQQVIDRVLQATGLKDRYPDIQLDHLFVEPREDNWFADVQFIIPHIMNGYGNCGWYTAAQIDLQTFEVYPNGVAVGNQKC